ncbi:aminotransferase class V-fold PLP-dependent enzyme [Cellulomonas triticagri]|uniref:Aminotransferase class V-fold PLP-dependent enzyme n=1 Tax=Cellulomonas triticagri TaxID=2483352 RepID=A0A3M2JBL3_9CELL|nr:aminotransferase class V-fold PLP-dependent enzyme [Cellulomonas triticagri]RMI08913.1 aminotransferase class V-fold PLP-dependent enzyme [Cellulomonas triticagri]
MLPLADVRAAFDPAPGNLDAATAGVAPRRTTQALRADLDRWEAGRMDVGRYETAVASARADFGRLVGVPADRVAVGSQVSVMASVVAASLPDGAEVLCVEGDFTSMVFPFLAQGSRLRVRHVPASDLAEAVRPGTDLVAYSLVQSATGAVLADDAVVAAARAAGARTLCDLTQAAGWLPVDASRYDLTVTAAYKWLCAPRGTGFLTLRDDALRRPDGDGWLRPVQAGWYAGEDPWASCYGPAMHLAGDARRFDVSPAWQAWLGAAESVAVLAAGDPEAVRAHAVGLADAFRAGVGLGPGGSAVVTLPDPAGERRAALVAAGCRVAGRAGRVRLAFHLWNDPDDVARALDALVASGVDVLHERDLAAGPRPERVPVRG